MSVAYSAPPITAPRGGVLGVLEYVLRLAFFATVPWLIVVIAELVPMTAALVNMVLALFAFFFGEIVRRKIENSSLLGRLLKRQLAFEAYYKEHPPKPFVYYLFYPLLFPYWLAVREARREFWLFKGYTLMTISFILLGGVYRLFFVYQPELGPKNFLWPFAIGLVVETFAVIMLLMPMTTSVVALHRTGQRVRLIALLAVGLVSAGASLAKISARHRTFPSVETRYRVAQRTQARPAIAKIAMKKALEAAWAKRRAGSWGREDDGTLEGPALDAARATLRDFYREDEAAAFEMWTTAKKERPGLILLYAEGNRRGHPVFMAMRFDGTIVDQVKDIPKPARKMMRTVGEY
jgi:hypothetical protein